jgi:hypothetical protein
MNVIFFGPKGHFVMNKYLYLLNMEYVYHIVTIRVNEISWAHVWRLRSLYLRTGYDTCVAPQWNKTPFFVKSLRGATMLLKSLMKHR